MGKIHIPGGVKLIVGLISGDVELFKMVKAKLERKFGRVDFESGIFDFANTSYYKDEMGGDLRRKFLSFRKPINLKNIYKIKLVTNSLERLFSKCGKRKVNIDPGYLDLSKLVLFSTKDYSHRVYLAQGIFAEVTLSYRNKTFNPWPWTYPDYKSSAYIDVFNSIREIYKKVLERA